MNLLKLAHIGWPALLASMAASACSGNPAPPQSAFVYAFVEPGLNDSGVCGESGAIYLALGSSTSPQPTAVADGASSKGGKASVSCSVDSNGGGYDIKLAATFTGPNGGSMFVSGHVDSSAGGSNINGSFTQQGQQFSENGCTITPEYNNSALPPSAYPQPGRIWGHIDCPHALVPGQYVTDSSGNSVQRSCDAWADFYFINCN